jgi:hypothetical protein
VLCPLCGARKARRACPALGHQICRVCCGTKRQTEIRCPPDCVYLSSALDHPPAVVQRQQHQALALLVDAVRDFNDRQGAQFVAIAGLIGAYQPPPLQTITDEDVVASAAALAATFETAARGVIYEHRAASPAADRLAAAVRDLLAEAGRTGGSAFERDAAVVLRRIERSAAAAREINPGNPRTYLDLLKRFVRKPDDAGGRDEDAAGEPVSRLIVP